MKKTVFLFLILFQLSAFAQNVCIGIKYTGITIHPKHENNAPLYKAKMDKKGHFVFNGGLTFTLDIKIHEWLGFKFTQSFVKYDCAGKTALMTHLGANFGGHGTTFGASNHGLSGSVDPMLFIRESWKNLPGYVHDEHLFGPLTDKKWTTKFLFVGGQFEYNYFYNAHEGISVNVLPGIPDLIAISPGISFRK